MKKIFTCLMLLASLNLNCAKSDENLPVTSASACGTYKSGQQLYLGSEGGCYYVNANGNKTYVNGLPAPVNKKRLSKLINI